MLELPADPRREVLKLKSERGVWYRLATLIHTYHQSKILLEGKAKIGRIKRGWTMKNTADDLGISKASVSTYLRLYEAGKNNEEIRKETYEAAIEKLREG